MPRRVLLEQHADFTGGLVLNADAFQIAENEVCEAMNVNFTPRGGVECRDGVQYVGTSAYASPYTFWAFAHNAANYLIAQVSSTLIYYSTNNGASWSSSGVVATVTDRMHAAAMSSITSTPTTRRFFIQRATQQAPLRFNGTTWTALTQNYNANIASPTYGNMPKAYYIAEHGQYMVVARTLEGSTVYGSRVRWSHPGEPEDWRSTDYIDIEPGLGEIRAIASMNASGAGDSSEHRLLVFKSDSIHMIAGSLANPRLVLLARGIGCGNQASVDVSERGVAFFDPRRGPMLFDGNSFTWIGEPLDPIWPEGLTEAAELNAHVVRWVAHRLYVSITGSTTYVWDSTVGKRGAWTQMDVPFREIRQIPWSRRWFGLDRTYGTFVALEEGTTVDRRKSITISSIVQSGNTVTVTCAETHGLSVGDYVTITGLVPDAADGTFRVIEVPATVPPFTGPNIFKYNNTVTGSVGGGGDPFISLQWDTTEPNTIGMTFGGGFLWTCSTSFGTPWTDTIEKWNESGTLLDSVLLNTLVDQPYVPFGSMAYGGGYLWVTTLADSPENARLFMIEPSNLTLHMEVTLVRDPAFIYWSEDQAALYVTYSTPNGGMMWGTDNWNSNWVDDQRTISRFDPTDMNHPTHRAEWPTAYYDIWADASNVYVTNRNTTYSDAVQRTVVKLDPDTMVEVDRLELAVAAPDIPWLLIGDGTYLYVSDWDDTLWRVDPTTMTLLDTWTVAQPIQSLMLANTFLWASVNASAPYDVAQIDPADGTFLWTTAMANGGWAFPHAQSSTYLYWGDETSTEITQVDYSGSVVDGASATIETPIESYFRTGWYAAGTPGIRKRWRRPTFIFDCDGLAQTLQVFCYRDYRLSTPRLFTIEDIPPIEGMLWGDNWLSGNWWAEVDEEDQEIDRGSGLGRAYAVSLKVVGPMTGDTSWRLNAFDLRYIPRRVR